MTSVDSGVETGNDSNDGAQLENLSNQPLTKVTTAITSAEKQISTTLNMWNLKQHEPKLVESEVLAPLTKSAVKSFIAYNKPIGESYTTLADLQFKFPTNFSLPVQDKPDYRECGFQPIRRRKVTMSRKYSYGYNKIWERRMQTAVTTNNVDLMKDILKRGYSPNISDCSQRTPLHLAACRGYTDMVKLLLDHGANPNKVDSLFNTPLHLAAVTCKYDVITLLLEAGADVLSSDRHGYNPLQLAQSKLRLLQSCYESNMNLIKEEIHKIINMLLAYLKKQNNANEQIEELSSFCSRISLSNTEDQVQCDLNGLLASIDGLNLKT